MTQRLPREFHSGSQNALLFTSQSDLRSTHHDPRLYLSSAVFHFSRDLGRFVVRAPRHRRLDSLVTDRGRDLACVAFIPRLSNGLTQKLRTAAYGMSMIGACQNAAFCPVGSSTVTWQLYCPGGSLLSDRLNFNGTVFSLLASPSDTGSGSVSNTFVCPR